ncbi:MAG: SGNH/GDSL hydrolase family protein [Candidatus Pacearchaeota archaeon]
MKEKTKKKIVLFIVILIIGFLLSETVLRFFLAKPSYPVEQVRLSEFKDIGHELIPNIDVIDEGPIIKLKPVKVKTNSFGIRDKEYSLEKPKNIIRIIGLGDSVTFGAYIEEKDTFLNVLEEKLNENGNYEVINFALSGYNTEQNLAVLKHKAIKFNPDIVLLVFVYNDFEEPTNPIAEDSFIQKLRNLMRHVYTVRLAYWNYIKLTEESKIETEYSKLDETRKQITFDSMKKMAEISKKNNVKFVVLIWPHLPVWQNDFYQGYKKDIIKLAEESKFYVIEMDDIWQGYNEEELIVPKEGHPNALANRIVGEKLYESFLNQGIIEE